jgi:hypothetical protein
MNLMSSNVSRASRHGRHLLLATAVAAFALAASATVSAQSTAGKVFGKAPAGASVAARSNTTGTRREVKVADDGRYSIRELPVGTYTVTLKENGQAVMKHVNVPVIVGRGIQVDFDCAPGKCTETAGK